MSECLFVQKEVLGELQALGLKVGKESPPFQIDGVDGILVSEEIISDFIKISGVSLEKTTTNYAEIYGLLGYILPAAKEEELIGPKIPGLPAVPATPITDEKVAPNVMTVDMCDGSDIKIKLRQAATLLAEVAAALD